jgi:glycosyltransferase involved in cell wall biosynthesis
LRVQVREEIQSARAFDRILVNSYYSRESILRAYGIEAHVCYLGVDTNRFVDKGYERERKIVGIGAFSPSKRIDAVISAIASLPEDRPELVWIGDRDEGGELRRLKDLARKQEIVFSPVFSAPHEAVVELLNQASLMVYAPRLEPFGYAPLEAAACGLPVVAKAEGGVRESVVDQETGILVNSDDDLGPAIATLLRDPRKAREMGRAARRNAESKWSLQAAVTRLEAHLVTVAGVDKNDESPKEDRL